jgi:hypothetical protein
MDTSITIVLSVVTTILSQYCLAGYSHFNNKRQYCHLNILVDITNKDGPAICSVSLNSSSRSEPETILYCLIWDSPNLEGQVPVFISPRIRVAQLYTQALGSLYVVSYDSQSYGGGILTLPLPGGTGPCIYSLQE